jgi:hypothetical protein
MEGTTMRNDFCSNYLEHSALGTTWKKDTKYVKKIKKNGKWVYVYSIDDEKVTGQARTKTGKDEYLIRKETAAGKQYLSKEATQGYHDLKAREKTIRGAAAVEKNGRWLSDKEKNAEADKYGYAAYQFAREAQRYGEAATRQKIENKKKLESNPINKAKLTGATIAEKTKTAVKKTANKTSKSVSSSIKRGQKKINDILSKLKTTETVTIKDTFTGETRTPNRSGETINIKKASEKNKKKKKK